MNVSRQDNGVLMELETRLGRTFEWGRFTSTEGRFSRALIEGRCFIAFLFHAAVEKV